MRPEQMLSSPYLAAKYASERISQIHREFAAAQHPMIPAREEAPHPGKHIRAPLGLVVTTIHARLKSTIGVGGERRVREKRSRTAPVVVR